jgi:Protein of unknown function (DUF1493)
MKDRTEDVIQFTKALTRPFRAIENHTVLQTDLGMDGDDAVEFFAEFFEKFGIDSSRFHFADHFGPEQPPSPLTLFRGIFAKPKRKPALITVKNLIDAANTNVWLYQVKSD